MVQRKRNKDKTMVKNNLSRFQNDKSDYVNYKHSHFRQEEEEEKKYK